VARRFLESLARSGSAPPLVFGDRQLPQLLIQVGPLAAHLSELLVGQEAALAVGAARCAPARDTSGRWLGRLPSHERE
jgi:hypothetical protein